MMKRKRLEIWGGVECTVNRVGDGYFNQMSYNGHYKRLDDLNLFSKIGIKTLRFPFLWELVAPNGIKTADWSWTDSRAERLQQLGVRPIAGLVHHGSGPKYTSLIDPEFGEKLATYAGAVAERYPWIEDYTPVNEQLTTARFSGLYGVWYPHHTAYPSMLRALVNECRGTVLSMKAIREINPQARLIQTDDLGRATSTPTLEYEANFQNERRWLGYDLLCGRVNSSHPLWSFMLKHGITSDELNWFEDNQCPPDIIGINHYVLSNRYFDEKKHLYPERFLSANEIQSYTDVETVRLDKPRSSPKELIREAWDRYHIPLAITEVHIDAGREDQMRWLMEVWNAAKEAQEEDIDVRAVTAWGLLGHFDWHCLLARCEGYYESGVYDVRSKQPRPTLLAQVIDSLSETQNFEHPLLEVPGWWHREDRILYPKPAAAITPESSNSFEVSVSRSRTRPLLITGANGRLGRGFAQACETRGIPYRILTRRELDITDSKRVEQAIKELRPWALINAAGFTNVDEAELSPSVCFRENLIGPQILSDTCNRLQVPLLTFSSAHVFDGLADTPYMESSATSPLNVYGKSKSISDVAVLKGTENALVIRAGSFFGSIEANDFVSTSLLRLMQGRQVQLPKDLKISPTYIPDLVHVSLNLLLDGETGLWHLSHPSAISWCELIQVAAETAHIPTRGLREVTVDQIGFTAQRPRYSALSSERGVLLPGLDQAILRYASTSLKT